MPSGGAASGGGMPGSSAPSGGASGDQSAGTGGGSSAGQTAGGSSSSSPGTSGGDPGFGDAAGGDLSLPSLVDEQPTYSSASASPGEPGESADGSSGSGSGSQSSDGQSGQSSQGSGPQGSQTGSSGGSPSAAAGGTVVASGTEGTGTRAQGGLEPDWGSDPMTTAERVAVLDRQLEASTGVFDAIIREEQRQQRSSRREQGNQSQSTGDSGTESVSGGRNPYEASDDGGYGSVGEGIGGRSGAAPENPAVFEAPEDIPSGNDDDIVARQLREAAMREADPEVREALWNEYRKYKGIEIPKE